MIRQDILRFFLFFLHFYCPRNREGHTFGALDAQTRYSMQDEIIRIWKSEKKTIIFVTNNIEEALYLGDRIVLLSRQPASVKEIYSIGLPRPRDMLSADFLELREKISANMDITV